MAGSLLIAIMTLLTLLSPVVSAEDTIRISGTGGGISGMRLVGEAFEKRNPGVKVNVLHSIGSTGGIKAVKAGKLDLAVTSRRLKEEDKVPGLVEEPYAKTAFIFATSSSNRVEGLRMSEILEIYEGKRTAWPDGGGIYLVLRPASDAYTVYLKNLAPGMDNAVESAQQRRGMFIGITDQDAADQIEKTAGSFGVTSYSLVASEKRKIKPLAVDGISPFGRNGVNEKYPYLMTFYLVYMKDRYNGAVRNLIDYIASKEGGKILRMNGHIPTGKAQDKP